MAKSDSINRIPALRVRQWLAEWDEIRWDSADKAAKPQPGFYQFSMSAQALRALCGIYPRTTKRKRGAEDLGIQRRHEVERSEDIREFVKYGYPWSEMSEGRRKSGEFRDLRQPGWLPTAIVVNILVGGDSRRGKKVHPNELVTIKDETGARASIELPKGFSGRAWRCKTIPPFEVIDGQHRLWAFDEEELDGDFELPVVAFVGLDLRWQAYLFYTINIKPKKINASLAFDLYPLLRTQEWLTKFEGHIIYREARAQELVDLLWSHSSSPWHHRINMLGERGQKGLMVTQAGWVRSLLASFVKSWEGPGVRIGGLFGSVVGAHDLVLPWSRLDQAAFLMFTGQALQEAIARVPDGWANDLRDQSPEEPRESDPAFYGPNCLINQDQGIRTFLQVLNDLVYVRADELALGDWGGQQGSDTPEEEQIAAGIKSLRKHKKINPYVETLVKCLATYDWRSSDAPNLSENDRQLKASFRGSGGYKELRNHVLKHVVECKAGDVSRASAEVLKRLGY